MKPLRLYTHTHTHTTHFLRDKNGVSLIALVITIIVVIILAAIAFNSSTTTIGKANYSKFVTNISEVQSAIRQKMITVKGTMMANGTEVTDGQIYNYIAKGGTSESDILVESKVPDYTVIEKEADIGIKLPVMKVNTPSKTGAEVKYAVTDNGVIFIWPPFPHEEKYYVNENETVDADVISSSGELEIKVADKLLKIESNENGEIQTKEIIYDGLTRKEFEEIKEKVKVGGYVNYTPTSATIQTDPSKTGYSTKETLTTDTSAKWRILSIDEDTGKVLITTQGAVNNVTLSGATGYLFGANELHKLCEKLYSNQSKGLTAKSMTIETLNYDGQQNIGLENKKIAYYPMTVLEKDMQNVTVGKTTYRAYRHEENYENGVTEPNFYTWMTSDGITINAMNERDSNKLRNDNFPILINGVVILNNTINADIEDILGENKGFIATGISEFSCGIHVHYSMPIVKRNERKIGFLVNSRGTISTTTAGLRPVVSFNINRLDISDTTKTGTESAPWEIK